MTFKGVFADILDLILPPRCHLCGESLTSREEVLCGLCLHSLPRTSFHTFSENPVEERFAGKFPFDKASSYLFYSPHSGVASLVQDFKYRNFPSIAQFLGRHMANEMSADDWFAGIDYLMPVPLYWWKQMKRGYCQTKELAKGISSVTGIGISNDLKACRPHRSQTHFSHADRLKNAEGIFRLSHPEKYEGKSVLLIDDVCTTGATLISAADAILKDAPNSRLNILTLAVTY